MVVLSGFAQKVNFVENLSLNTENAEFAPVLNEQGKLVFVSNRTPKLGVVRFDKDNNTSFYDLFVSEDESNKNNTSKVGRFNKELNTKYHEGPLSFDFVNKIAYFTKSNIQENKKRWSKDGKIKLQIFSAPINADGSFGSLTSFEYNNDDYSVGHPTISKDGNILIFSSDMPGGFGASDLYVTEKKNGKWGKPVNLGKEVNTMSNELFPFLSAENDLYFSSNNSTSKGGLDVFCSKAKSSTSFEAYKPVGGILNSIKDDFGFVIDSKSDEITGFYTSNKDGGKGGDDIYRWKGESEFRILSGIVLDENGSPIAGAEIKATKSNGEVVSVMSDDQGLYELNLGSDREVAQVLIIANNQFPIKFDIDETNTDNHDFDMQGLPYLAGSVIDSKTGKPVPGVEIIIIDNFTKKRSDFETKENGGIYAPIVGYDMGDKLDYNITLKRTGYLGTSMRYKDILIHGGAFEIFMDPVKLYEAEEGLDIGKVFDLNPIYYEYNKSDITPAAAIELDKIVKAMKENPSLTIELGSHTDARGGNSFNKKLSNARSKSAASYIKSKISDRSRIYGEGYGEEKMINSCQGDECSEEEHAINRRTEFKIVKY